MTSIITMELTYYAPVAITTLNRFEHFKRCIESLEKCTGSEKTTVFVALDYPPSDKYIEGWGKIDNYLKAKEIKNNFKQMVVYRRDHNYGVCKEGDNFEILLADVSSKFDRYILTEDDNEFSPNFLEYMNKALEKFYDDERINLVCGYNYQMKFPEMYHNNFYLTKHGCPWGTGHWVHKTKPIKDYYRIDKLREIIRDDKQYKIIKNRAPHSLRSMITMIKKKAIYSDAIIGMYAALYDKYCVLPRESLVRNWGNDGTGEHNPKKNLETERYYSHQHISESNVFEFSNDIFTYEPLFLERKHFKSKPTLYSIIKSIHSNFCFAVDTFLLRNFNYIPSSKLI